MVVIHRTARRLKDTFQYARPYDEIRSRRRILGRRVLSTKKLLCLPFNSDSNNNVNVNEIPSPPPLPSSFITKKQLSNDNRHDVRQSKLKEMLIDELKTFFISRNQNYSQSDHHIHSETSLPYQSTTLTEKYPIEHKKRVSSFRSKKQRTMDFKQTIANKARTNLLRNTFIQSSDKASSIFSLLTNTLLYSTSFTFGCFGAQCVRQTKLFSAYQFGRILTRSLLLQTCLTLLVGTRSLTQRALSLPAKFNTSSTNFLFKRQDILLRIITSILHLITGFVISLDSKNIL